MTTPTKNKNLLYLSKITALNYLNIMLKNTQKINKTKFSLIKTNKNVPIVKNSVQKTSQTTRSTQKNTTAAPALDKNLRPFKNILKTFFLKKRVNKRIVYRKKFNIRKLASFFAGKNKKSNSQKLKNISYKVLRALAPGRFFTRKKSNKNSLVQNVTFNAAVTFIRLRKKSSVKMPRKQRLKTKLKQ